MRGHGEVQVVHGDAREVELPGAFDAVVTSPPYPGLIDYHEQHRYAYELLGLDDRRERELGAAARGTSRAAIDAYVEGVGAVLGTVSRALAVGGRVVVVVNDSREPLHRDSRPGRPRARRPRHRRHVNRRTGRRAGEYFEEILVARPG